MQHCSIIDLQMSLDIAEYRASGTRRKDNPHKSSRVGHVRAHSEPRWRSRSPRKPLSEDQFLFRSAHPRLH